MEARPDVAGAHGAGGASGTRALTVQVASLVAAMAEGGVVDAVAAPGSRSTPLTLALARHPTIRLWMHYDERSAGYFALGLAKRRGRPVAVVVTSGTAAANLLPSIAEARQSGVPLVVLTADRPPELQEVGAAQTLRQTGLFGPHVKWAIDLVAATEQETGAAQARSVGRRAARLAATAPRGPVHVNVPLREPLVPGEFPWPPTAPDRLVLTPPGWTWDAVREAAGAERGVIIAGAADLTPAVPTLLALAEAWGWPVFADPLSNLRQTGHPQVLTAYDAWLRAEPGPTPDTVVRLGPPPTSKALQEWTAGARTVLIDERERWRDAGRPAAAVFWVDDWAALPPVPSRSSPARIAAGPWVAWDRWSRRCLTEWLDALPEGFEGRLYARFASALDGYAALMVGNSMPIRDLDTFWSGEPAALRVYGNRGVNGIDGVVSTGLGLAAVDGPVAVIVGDLSAWHDVGGLLAARWHGLHVALVVVNNNGGGIFSFLSQAELPPAEFEPLFGTPLGVDWAGVAASVGAPFIRTDTVDDVVAALQEARRHPELTVIEWRTLSRRDNVLYHRRLFSGLKNAGGPNQGGEEPCPPLP